MIDGRIQRFRLRGLQAHTPTIRSRPGSSETECAQQHRRLAGRQEEFHLTGPGTDLQVDVAGRIWINRRRHAKLPGWRDLHRPGRGSASTAHVSFSFPVVTAGREIEGILLRFEKGKVVEATATRGQEYLRRSLDTDEGARYLGEFAIGTNFDIQRFTKQHPLRREDRRHGPYGDRRRLSGNRQQQQSAVHWDMICDLRDGGEVRSTASCCSRMASSLSDSDPHRRRARRGPIDADRSGSGIEEHHQPRPADRRPGRRAKRRWPACSSATTPATWPRRWQSLGLTVETDERGAARGRHGGDGTFPQTTADLYRRQLRHDDALPDRRPAVGRGDYRIDGMPRMRTRPIGPLLARPAPARARRLGATRTPAARPCHRRRPMDCSGGRAQMAGGPEQPVLQRAADGRAVRRATMSRSTVVGDLVSKPYMEITAAVMRDFGVDVGDRPRRLAVVSRRGRASATRAAPTRSNRTPRTPRTSSRPPRSPAAASGSTVSAPTRPRAICTSCDVLEQMGATRHDRGR